MTVSVADSGVDTQMDEVTLTVTVPANDLLVVVCSPEGGTMTFTSDGQEEQIVTGYGDHCYLIPGPVTTATATNSVSGYNVTVAWCQLTSSLSRSVQAPKSPGGVGWEISIGTFPNTSFAVPDDNTLLVSCVAGLSSDGSTLTAPGSMTLEQSTYAAGLFDTGNDYFAGIATEAVNAGTITRDWTADEPVSGEAFVLFARDPADAAWAAPIILGGPCWEYTYRWPQLYQDLLSGDEERVRKAVLRLEERDRELEAKIQDCCCGGGGGGVG